MKGIAFWLRAWQPGGKKLHKHEKLFGDLTHNGSPDVACQVALVCPLYRPRAYDSGWMWPCCSYLLHCLKERQPLEGRLRPDRIVLPAPTIVQDLRLESCGEKLDVEEFIPVPAIDRLGKSVFQLGS